jgi:hypothetical protein
VVLNKDHYIKAQKIWLKKDLIPWTNHRNVNVVARLDSVSKKYSIVNNGRLFPEPPPSLFLDLLIPGLEG